MNRKALILSIAIAAAAMAACRKAPVTTPDVVVVDQAKIALDPQDKAWRNLPQHVSPLLLQDLVEPRQMKATTPDVTVQAMTDGQQVAFRLSWADDVVDDMPGVALFADACAVQLPRKTGPDLPAPQMGETGRTVEITYWRATWQAVVDGKRKDEITDMHPRAAIDHYPFRAKPLKEGSPEQMQMAAQYAPARALGNMMAGPRKVPVETLLAAGAGTLAPDPALKANGKGSHDAKAKRWAVVLVRPLPEALRATAQSQAAFAVWQGGLKEVGARKMRTGWIAVTRQVKKP